MFDSPVIEVAIGIALVYFLLSLICSTINEFLAGLVNARSQTLERGIREMLQGGNASATMHAAVYSHPLIKGLYRKSWIPGFFHSSGKPSYIPSQSFALALLDVVAPNRAPGPTQNMMQKVRTQIEILPDTDAALRKTLLALLDTSEGNIERFRQNIERWFDDSMEQVSGWYKQNMQIIVRSVALAVCIFLNADSVAIAKALWLDPIVRAAVVAQAEAQAAQPGGKVTIKLDIPIGPESWAQEFDPLSKILGLWITTVAISLGAPFWFGMLNKLVSLRNAGEKPKRAAA
jgi:hypothetical protein